MVKPDQYDERIRRCLIPLRIGDAKHQQRREERGPDIHGIDCVMAIKAGTAIPQIMEIPMNQSTFALYRIHTLMHGFE